MSTLIPRSKFRLQCKSYTILPKKDSNRLVASPLRISKMSSLTAEEKVAQLEAELQALKISTTIALEKSWQEAELLRQNTDLQRGSYFDSRASFASDKPSLTSSLGSSGSEFELLGSSRELRVSDSVSVLSNRDTAEVSGTSSWSKSSVLSETFGSLSNWMQQRDDRRQTGIERDLMRQLHVLQEDKVRCIHDLEIKLAQREAAIKTLETALLARDMTVQTLRDELEEALKFDVGACVETERRRGQKQRKDDKQRRSMNRSFEREQRSSMNRSLEREQRSSTDDFVIATDETEFRSRRRTANRQSRAGACNSPMRCSISPKRSSKSTTESRSPTRPKSVLSFEGENHVGMST